MTKDITAEHVLNDLRYLTLLARSFPTVADASTEIINLEAILNLRGSVIEASRGSKPDLRLGMIDSFAAICGTQLIQQKVL